MLFEVGKLLGVSDYLEVTVQDNGSLDLSEFDVEKHAGILLDGVGDVQMLADNRESLQGRAKAERGGKSTTMVYSYPFTLRRRAMVATMDRAAKNLALLQDHHWLSRSENVLRLELTAPAFVHA